MVEKQILDFIFTDKKSYMEIVDIQCKDDLIGHKVAILKLFKEGFERELDDRIWNWAYLDNIFGDPIVSLAYDHDRLVAHYAVIPLHLANSGGKSLDSYLSMTTVVAQSHRKYGLFVDLAKRVNSLVKEKSISGLIIGFPNKQSAPGFRKRLDWKINDVGCVVRVNKRFLLESESFLEYFQDSSRYTLDMNSVLVRNWRMMKPGGEWLEFNNVLLKRFGDEFDLMYFDDPEALKELPDDLFFNMIVDQELMGIFSDDSIRMHYQFGYRIEEKCFIPDFKLHMVMSDVF